ncbi:Putative DNA-binding domain-containing protein [Parasphingorhabdus marina DSM 22363]|uniref:Putative DNA-binding domain-containing protein n=1 Tax=Parasphingorhabdus marina DSM 22363 TaxID=1123272 RepID=A0A1N6CRU2_9SPHN|nr:putative DNA-binding domain-containing protein [Parasphingorhabdus marina]SIN61114.1 Putative DNA-binding domain-containing protein [Parasphingorhabdus marina DSM 22363]
MPSLADGQNRFMACLQKGPGHFPADLFSETDDRALLGLRAHANTVSHARLVALENAYPKLHAHMGHEPFHKISRDYIEQDHILTCDMNNIARDFPEFLHQNGLGASEIDLARAEWGWIESYNSAEAPPLVLEDIAALAEDQLLAFPVAAHPAARLIRMAGPLSPELSELGEETPAGLIIARPEAEVLFHPVDATSADIAEKIANISTMGNLLSLAIELGDETSAMDRIVHLIRAGTMTKRKQDQDNDETD